MVIYSSLDFYFKYDDNLETNGMVRIFKIIKQWIMGLKICIMYKRKLMVVLKHVNNCHVEADLFALPA